jgi:hypothetical protein
MQPVGLRVGTLLFPFMLLVASGLTLWAGHAFPAVSPATEVIGGIGGLLAMLSAWVIAPVALWLMISNPALRTPGQISSTLTALLVMLFPALAMFGGGV